MLVWDHDRVDDEAQLGWYSVRCVIEHGQPSGAGGNGYEERITLWRASSFDEAIERAEAEATRYADGLDDSTVTDLVQAYHLFDEPGDGAEIFSLIRESHMQAESYITALFDTGTEHQQT